MTIRNLHFALEPAAIAVVGDGPRATMACANLAAGGYAGLPEARLARARTFPRFVGELRS